MQDLSTLSNDEIFKLLKSSGINAGPITPSTRSVYEKKLKRYFDEMNSSTTETDSHTSPVKQTKTINLEPVVNLKAIETESVFVKPLTPKARKEPEPEIIPVEKTRKSILRKSTEETHFDTNQSEPVYYHKEEITTFNAANKIQPKIRSEMNRDTNSPMRQTTISSYRKEPSPVKKDVYELKLLKPKQTATVNSDQMSTSYREPNIRKRTATIEKPVPVTETKQSTNSTVKAKESGAFVNLKYMIMVIIMTVVVYFVMNQLQSNPENPVE